VFTKGGRTDQVFFYDVAADGYSLDDKRQKIDADDLPDVVEQWRYWKAGKGNFADRRLKAFAVSADAIRENGYDLSVNRYKEAVQEEVQFEPPAVILGRMKALEAEIQKDMAELALVQSDSA